MEIYNGNNEYMKELVKEGARNIKSERSRWKKQSDDDCPGEYGHQPLRNYRGNIFNSLFIADDTVKSPLHLHRESKDESYRHAANMLANQVHEFLSIPGVNVNIFPKTTLNQAIDTIIQDLE